MNLIHDSLPESDRELFFGPLDGQEQFIGFGDNDNLATLLVKVDKFPSLSQAHKNGFDKPLAPGFAKIKVGKTILWILNRFERCDE